ncbi:unnamed protein product [Ceratitis capitata]|uniref:(Mediterranean fruit fly) hypothetical protein n=1 Tax=Ceratitis capitata TaxID=7213 RepID=A0A811U9D7_CERCA|nr:unnamed protein product [Ceratitis capitata]
MSCEDKKDLAKLEGQISLLKQEHAKLQLAYAELDKKYREEVSTLPVGNEHISSFVSSLMKTVASLYNNKLYSDINVKIGGGTKPAHKFVLHSRSEDWTEEILILPENLTGVVLKKILELRYYGGFIPTLQNWKMIQLLWDFCVHRIVLNYRIISSM